jgi:DNA-binding beta-propeller fold protein YncE
VNRELGEVSVFDARSGVHLATVPTGAGAHEVAISNRVHKAYITNETANTVSIVSTRTLDDAKLSLGPAPHHVEPSRDGRTVLVGLVGTNVVAAVDATTGEVSRRYTSSSNPDARAHGPFLLGKTIYVAHETGNEVTGIDRDTGDIEFTVGGIIQPTEVLPDRHRRRLYVSARGEGKVKVFDLETHAAIGEVTVGTQPETLLLTRDRKTLIVSLRGTPARLAFVDTRRLVVTATVDLAGAGSFGDLAAMSRNGRYVYATFDRGATGVGGVAVVDVRRRTVIDTWAYPGVGRVHGVAFSPDWPH